MNWKPVLVVIVLCVIQWTGSILASRQRADEYEEELVIKRLPTNHLAASFRFSTTTDSLGVHFDLFPRVIGEYLKRYEISEFHFSLSQTSWRSRFWGFAPQPPAPSGAQVSAWFYGNATTVDERWSNLIHALSGLFCASLLQMVPTLTASPHISFRPIGLSSIPFTSKITTKTAEEGQETFSAENSTIMGRYAALATENVCTENLTPWKKLLPCKEAGLSLLLHPIKLYEAQYHSLSVDAIQVCPNGEISCRKPRWRLVQSLVTVSDVPLQSKVLDWNLQSLFGSRVHRKCDLAKHSKILVEIEKDLAPVYSPTPPEQPMTYRNGRRFHVYEVRNEHINRLGAAYGNRSLTMSPVSPPSVTLHSFVAENGQQSGRLVSRIVNRNKSGRRAVYTHLIPWFLRVYYHTLRVQCSNETDELEVVEAKRFQLALDRSRPYLLELVLHLPPQSTCDLSVFFEKSFLRWTEHPPDANRGFFVPAASILFRPDDWTDMSVIGGYTTTALQELSGQMTTPLIRIFGEVLLVQLPVPDFSMPYNVICLVCTVIALCFGPVHNLTTKTLVLAFEPGRSDALTPKAKIKEITGKILTKLKRAYSRIRSRGSKKTKSD